MICSKLPLVDIDLSTSVVLDVDNSDDKIIVDTTIDDKSENPVSNKGIYDFLEDLSGDIFQHAVAEARSYDLSVEPAGVIPSGQGAVKSGDIYSFGMQLQSDIINSIKDAQGEPIHLGLYVTKDGEFGVKSSGIWSFCDTLSTAILLSAYDNDQNLNVISQVEKDNDSIVDSKGIYEALEQLSVDTLNSVPEQEFDVQNTVTKNGLSCVRSSGIWEFCDTLSTTILLSAYDNDISLVDNVTKTGKNAVKSSGIWTKLSSVSCDVMDNIPHNYLSIDDNVENYISSYNEFTTRSTWFELDNGPQIGLNVNPHIDIAVGGKYFVVPDTDYGPGAGINDNTLSIVAGDGHDQISADLFATRAWVNNRFSTIDAHIDVDEHLDNTSTNPVENRAITNELNNLNDRIDYALYSSDLVDQFVVTKQFVYYYKNNSDVLKYSSLYEALEDNPEFGIDCVGKIKIAEDLEWKAEDYPTMSTITAPTFRLRKLLFNLDNHKITSTCKYMMIVCDNAEVVLMNGSFYAESHNGFMIVNGGKLWLKNVDVEILDNDPDEDSYFYLVQFGQVDSTDILVKDGVVYSKLIGPNSVIYRCDNSNNLRTFPEDDDKSIERTRSEIYVDRFSSLRMTNCHHDYNMGIWATGPYLLCKILGDKTQTYPNGKTIIDSCPELQPYIELDGKLELIYTDAILESDRTTLAIAGYGTYTYGADYIGAKINIKSNAEIYVNHGHGLYCSNQHSEFTINGGKIVGSNGITMRAGHLNIPRTGNPEIIGIGDFVEYDPGHKSGQAGNGIFVGNAVFIEECVKSTSNNGYGHVYPNIESGNFVSKNNTTIGAYANSKTDETIVRPTKFVSGGTLNRIPTSIPYDRQTGHYSDYDIIADGYVNSIPTMIIKENLY